MIKTQLEQALAECAATVLEQMFFVQVVDRAVVARPAENDLLCRVGFTGEPSGSLWLRLSRKAAWSIAANFLGTEEDGISISQAGQVVCELANIICGSLLSRVESGATFQLGMPQLQNEWDDRGPVEAGHTVPLDNGVLLLEFLIERPPCPAAA